MNERFRVSRKTQVLEAEKRLSRDAGMRWGRLALASAAFFAHTGFQEPRAAADTPNTESVEVIAGMGWQGGLHALRHSVYHSPGEHIAEFAVRNDGTSSWVGSNAGEAKSVGADTKRTEALRAAAEKGEFQKVCILHTHPLTAIKGQQIQSGEELASIRSQGTSTLSMPPSPADIESSDLSPYPIETVSGLVDPAGIWYFRSAEASDYLGHEDVWESIQKRRSLDNEWKLFLRHLVETAPEEVLNAIVNESATVVSEATSHLSQYEPTPASKVLFLMEQLKEAPDNPLLKHLLTTSATREKYELWKTNVSIPQQQTEELFFGSFQNFVTSTKHEAVSSEWLQKIDGAYLSISGKVRFVSYEDSKKEPPCAGVDYKKN